MPFIQPDDLNRHEIFPGVISGLITGEHVMLSFVEMQQGTDLPEHAHPEEQAGYMLAGKLLLRIAGEERVLQPGDAYLIPGNTRHSATVIEGPMRVLDIFGPPRGDYRARMENAE